MTTLSQDTLYGIVKTFEALKGATDSIIVLGYIVKWGKGGYILATSTRLDQPNWQYTPGGRFEELDNDFNIVGPLF